MGKGLENLIFVAVAVAAWAIKVALERKEARRAKQRRMPRAPTGKAPATPRADSGEVDLVVGRSPLPPAVAPRPRVRAQPTVTTAPPLPTKPKVRPAAKGVGRRRGLGGLEGGAAADDVGGLEHRKLKQHGDGGLGKLGVGASLRVGRRGVRGARQRLGVAAFASPRDTVRAGVLWSEVLGMPRAITGPHRSPAARRASRG